MTDTQLRILAILVAITALTAAAIAIYRRILKDAKDETSGPKAVPGQSTFTGEDLDRILEGPGIKQIGSKNS